MDDPGWSLQSAVQRFTANVNGVRVGVRENTCYPMDGKIRIELTLPKRQRAAMTFRLRIPSWTQEAAVRVNGEARPAPKSGSLVEIRRDWQDGDCIELEFPMKVKSSNVWHENAVSIERGPLVYALKIDEKWEKVALDPTERKGAYYWEVSAQSPWNYAFLRKQVDRPENAFRVEVDEEKLKGNWYWNAESSPLRLVADAARVRSPSDATSPSSGGGSSRTRTSQRAVRSLRSSQSASSEL